MAHQADLEQSKYTGAFADGFNPGPQGNETGWTTVNKKKNYEINGEKKEMNNYARAGEKRKISVDTMEEENDEDVIETTEAITQEMIKAAGEKDIREKTRYTSKLRIEFNLGYTNDTFKARKELLHI
eukprot:11493437-Ditylum_brightwellii.AAC.1